MFSVPISISSAIIQTLLPTNPEISLPRCIKTTSHESPLQNLCLPHGMPYPLATRPYLFGTYQPFMPPSITRAQPNTLSLSLLPLGCPDILVFTGTLAPLSRRRRTQPPPPQHHRREYSSIHSTRCHVPLPVYRYWRTSSIISVIQ